MQPKTDQEAPGQGSAGGNGGMTDPLAGLTEQIEELDQRISELQGEIQEMESGLESANAGIERARKQKKDLDARKANLSRLVDGYKAGQQKTAGQRQAAEADAKAARELLDQVRADLDEELAEEYRQQIDQIIEELDGHVAGPTDAANQKQGEADQAATALADAQAAATGAEAALRPAQNDLRGLPGMLQSRAAQVKKDCAELEKASDGGQATEAYLLAHELESALSQLGGPLNPGHEQALAQKVEETWTSFEAASDAVPGAEAAVAQVKAELEQIQAELKDYTDNRRAKIEAQLEEDTAGESPGALSPAAAGAERA